MSIHVRDEVPHVRIKIRPSDDSFYDYFSRAAENLVKGTALLSELALPGADVQSIGERLVEVEHDSDRSRTSCTTRSTRRSSRRSTARTSTASAPASTT